MIDKTQAKEYLESSMTETMLQYMAKNYAVNVMILRRLALLFVQGQLGRPLTEQEAAAVSAANEKLQAETENRAIADLHRALSAAGQHAIVAAHKVEGATEQ